MRPNVYTRKFHQNLNEHGPGVSKFSCLCQRHNLGTEDPKDLIYLSLLRSVHSADGMGLGTYLKEGTVKKLDTGFMEKYLGNSKDRTISKNQCWTSESSRCRYARCVCRNFRLTGLEYQMYIQTVVGTQWVWWDRKLMRSENSRLSRDNKKT